MLYVAKNLFAKIYFYKKEKKKEKIGRFMKAMAPLLLYH